MPAIVLVGPMGVGKTTIGKKLAKAMNLPFVDTDQLFVKEHGSITDFFEASGETIFREIEETLVLGTLSSSSVVATGGGVILSARTRSALESAFVVYLATDGRHMASRLSGGGRPLLQNGLADWRRIYESRKPLYLEVANLTVDTSNNSLAEVISQIREGVAKDERF